MLRLTALPPQAAAPSGVGSKLALPEYLVSMDPVPMQAPPAAPAQLPAMMIEQVLQHRHHQQQQLLGQLSAQQQYGGTLMPGMVPQGTYMGQQPLPPQQQQQFFQNQAPQQQQQYFMQPQQAQPASVRCKRQRPMAQVCRDPSWGSRVSEGQPRRAGR